MSRNYRKNIVRNCRLNVNNQPSVRNVEQPLRICQINVEGMSRAKGDYLVKLLTEENISVALIQESHTESSEDLASRGNISGFDMVVAEYSRAHGIATYVKQGLANVNVIQSTSNDNAYSSIIRVGSLSVTNVYKAPQAQWPQSVLDVQPHPAIYAGDFNSHHCEWGYSSDDENGESVVSWASNSELCLVHDAKDRRTFHSKAHNTESNPDLCFVSADSEGIPLHVTRTVLPGFPNSQHRPVIFEVGMSIPIISSVPRPRWNFRKANWNDFSSMLDAAVRFIPPTPKNYDRFNNLIISIAKKSVPRGYRKKYIPCWNEDSDRLYAEFQGSENPEVAKELLKSLDEARKQRWVETVKNIDIGKAGLSLEN